MRSASPRAPSNRPSSSGWSVGSLTVKCGRPKGRQQLESPVAKLTSPSRVDSTVRGEALEQGAEGGRPEVVKRAEHRNAPQRLTVEDVGVVVSSGVLSELGQRRRTAAHHDDAVVWGALVPKVRAEVLSRRSFGHVP